MNEPGALDERLRTLVMQSFEGGGERLLYLNPGTPEVRCLDSVDSW
ncbi:MAG: hypothetical protein GY702_01510 [Desulfobulbaceae bacterium]|nr:hypothetical protein [Desulfobulbaceae bacterium]